MNLKQLRKEIGINIYKAAEKLHISRMQIRNIENSNNKADILKIEKLSKFYKKSIFEIKSACEVTYCERTRNNV